MDKKQFTEKVAKPVSFSSQDRGWLHAIKAKYPYSSVVGVLSLMADRAFNFDSPASRRQVALSLCSSDGLDSMLSKVSKPAEDSKFDVLNEINTYQEVSFKTAPKQEILTKFLQEGPAGMPSGNKPELQYSEADDKKSLIADESLATETMAIILERQGKYAKAIGIYKKLMAQNPEKSSNFAAQIERLDSILKQ